LPTGLSLVRVPSCLHWNILCV